MFTKDTATETRLFEMLTENTGVHLLDSGMSNGRHWQQNQKFTLEEWKQRQEAIVDQDGLMVSLDLFHFLNRRLTLTEKARDLQKWFEDYVDSNMASPFSCDTLEGFADEVEPGHSHTVANSYNWENFLSQDVQFVEFATDDGGFLLLQIHGGADIRGGYTAPQVFEITNEYWIHDCQDAELNCTNSKCEFSSDATICIQSGDVYLTNDEHLEKRLYEYKGCPKCGHDMTAHAPEPSW
jgi:hypothetical protein